MHLHLTPLRLVKPIHLKCHELQHFPEKEAAEKEAAKKEAAKKEAAKKEAAEKEAAKKEILMETQRILQYDVPWKLGRR